MDIDHTLPDTIPATNEQIDAEITHAVARVSDAAEELEKATAYLQRMVNTRYGMHVTDSGK